MRRGWLAFAAVVLLACAGTAQAAPADKHVELEADDGQGCLDQSKADCFRVVNGTDLDGIAQGDVVHVVLTNVGNSSHNVYATEAANADENNADTPADAAINGSETIDPGQTTDILFQVPWEAEGLYLWCDVGTHEATGMWLETDVATTQNVTGDEPADEAPDEANETGEDTDGGDDVGRFLPAPDLAATLAATLAAVLGHRHRRQTG